MTHLETMVFFLGLPAAAFGVATIALYSTYAKMRPRYPGPEPSGSPSPLGRLLVFPAILVTPIIFGAILWFLSLPPLTALDGSLIPGASNLARVHLWSAIAFGWTAAVTIASETVVARRRMRQALGADFGRVLPLVVIPETLSIFALILVFLILGVAADVIEAGASLSAAGVDATVLGLQLFAGSTFATPVGIVLSNRVEALDQRGFIRALLPAEAGVGIAIAGLAYAFLQIRSLVA
ncbi:MAG: hypothetical protein ACT4OI_09930 [Methanobacteriota archaeon]